MLSAWLWLPTAVLTWLCQRGESLPNQGKPICWFHRLQVLQAKILQFIAMKMGFAFHIDIPVGLPSGACVNVHTLKCIASGSALVPCAGSSISLGFLCCAVASLDGHLEAQGYVIFPNPKPLQTIGECSSQPTHLNMMPMFRHC